GGRGENSATRRLHKIDRRATTGRGAIGRTEIVYECGSDRDRVLRRLFEHRLRLEVVAVYHRPQAHRAALSGLDHALLLPGRLLRTDHPVGPDDAAWRPGLVPDLQQDVFDARHHHGFLLSDPFDPHRAR